MPSTYFSPQLKALFTCLLISGFIIGCGTQAVKSQDSPSTKEQYTFVDSTLYFDERNSSISMRATFERTKHLSMSKGYFFQFRTIADTPIFLNSISLIAGGKRIFLEKGQLILSKDQGLTLSLSLEDSLFAAEFPTALLQFRHNNISEIFAIELHRLDIFTPKQNLQ